MTTRWLVVVHGGVFVTYNDSSFNVTGCTFTHNHAIDFGGVALMFDSLLHVYSSIFINNTVSVAGGVLYTQAS